MTAKQLVPGTMIALALLLWPVVFNPPACLAEGNRTKTDAPRQDNVMGTMHEGIIIENDPDNGDNIIQVTPGPEADKKGEDQNRPLIIVPEIRLKPGKP